MSENERISATEIDLDAIADIGSSVPLGQYHCKLSVCNGKQSKKGNPMLEVRWEVLEGDEIGEEIPMWLSLVATRSAKNGKVYAMGLQEMKAIAAAVGVQLPKPFPLDASRAAQAFGLALANVHVDLYVVEDERDEQDAAGNKTGKKVKSTRAKIVGRWGTTPVASPAQNAGSVNPLAGMV